MIRNVVDLLDQNNEFIEKISINKARFLVGLNLATVNLREIYIKLCISIDDYKNIDWKKDYCRQKDKPVLKKVYGGYKVYYDGEKLFSCGLNRALWYLIRGAAEVIDENTISLTFIPNGMGTRGDAYYEQTMVNICVVCGTEYNLGRHHVVPYCYRKFFPYLIKKHTYHDILLLCCECHDKYESIAGKFKAALHKKYNCPNFKDCIDRNLKHVSKNANTILKYKDRIPEDRLNYLYVSIKDHFKKEDITEEDLLIASKINYILLEPRTSRRHPFKRHGEWIAEQLKTQEEYQEFFNMWREHFLSTMNPQYMPKNWDAHRVVNFLPEKTIFTNS